MKVDYIKIHQDGMILYIFKLTVSQLLGNSVVERYIFGKDTGYQRQPIPAHYKKIAKYFMENKSKAILPTAVLGAISPDDLRETERELELLGKIRIVDGQHRIMGLKCLNEGYTKNSYKRFGELKDTYEFPIILMPISFKEKKEELLEINTFLNINNKGKKVSTDLALAMREKIYRELYRNAEEGRPILYNDEVVQNTATAVSRKMAEDRKSPWYNLIIMGDDISKKKPVSITAFSKAIRGVVACSLGKFKEYEEIPKADLETEERMIKDTLNEAWRFVQRRWPECFHVSGELYYNNAYNIQKGVGVQSLYGLLSECIEEKNNYLKEGLELFEVYIHDSQVASLDWLVGGRFTGMTSGQAIKRLINIIKNEDMEM